MDRVIAHAREKYGAIGDPSPRCLEALPVIMAKLRHGLCGATAFRRMSVDVLSKDVFVVAATLLDPRTHDQWFWNVPEATLQTAKDLNNRVAKEHANGTI